MLLSGLLYAPSRPSSMAAVFLHGNGDSSVFTSARTNRFAAELMRRRIAFFPFDNRGAHFVKWMKRRRNSEVEPVSGGMSHERIRDCIHDIDGALRYLRSRGYRTFALVGHSTGANKICLYHFLKPRNRVGRYVLLAPGDDTGLYYAALGRKRFFRALERCRREIGRGQGDRFASRSLSPFLISWSSLYDTIDPDGDYNVFPFLEAMKELSLSDRKPRFLEYRSVTRPTLVVYGENDEFCHGDVRGCVELLRRNVARPGKVHFEILPQTDHGFHGKQVEVGRIIAEWLSSAPPGPIRR